MKEYKYFLIDIADYVATVTINNPKALNALSSPVIEEMISVVEELSAMTEEVRCVVLTVLARSPSLPALTLRKCTQ